MQWISHQCYKCLSVLILIFYLGSAQAQEYNFQELRARVVSQKSMPLAAASSLKHWVDTQQDNGSWADMPYGDVELNGKLEHNHLYRLWQLAAASSDSTHIYYKRTSLKNAVKKGLAFWQQSETKDRNWWFNKIYFPQRLGELLIFMRAFEGFIPKTSSTGIDEASLLSTFAPSRIDEITAHGAGANAVDIALHYVYRGLLTEDKALLEATTTKLDSTLTDNIKEDLMYQDHGPQVMIASYGPVYCEGLMRLASYLAGSPAAFDIQSKNFRTVLDFIRETQLSSIRGQSWDFNTLGRGVSRYNAMYAQLPYLKTLANQIDPKHKATYLNALGRLSAKYPPHYKVRAFNKHYWASDYTQHARKAFLFTIRNTSSRTVEAETGNGENLKANYFSYGANFISVDGTEYTNIMPLWDWAMLPGTTFPYTETFAERKHWGFNYGATTFVGGVSDGMYGASVLALKEAGIKAKKSWFMFDKAIVCLGAGIADSSGRNVRTTINQAWKASPLYYAEGDAPDTPQGSSKKASAQQSSNLNYIRHGNIAYYIMDNSKVKFSIQNKTAAWTSINTLVDSTKTETGEVFSLWIDHGKNPKEATYNYMLVPHTDAKQDATAFDPATIQLIENTAHLQAVYHQELNMYQAVFHKAGSMEYKDLKLTVNKPCALLLKEDTIVSISDPSQRYSDIKLSVETTSHKYTKVIELPSEHGRKGASVTRHLKSPNTN